jgi:hypothetical protein
VANACNIAGREQRLVPQETIKGIALTLEVDHAVRAKAMALS